MVFKKLANLVKRAFQRRNKKLNKASAAQVQQLQQVQVTQSIAAVSLDKSNSFDLQEDLPTEQVKVNECQEVKVEPVQVLSPRERLDALARAWEAAKSANARTLISQVESNSLVLVQGQGQEQEQEQEQEQAQNVCADEEIQQVSENTAQVVRAVSVTAKVQVLKTLPSLSKVALSAIQSLLTLNSFGSIPNLKLERALFKQMMSSRAQQGRHTKIPNRNGRGNKFVKVNMRNRIHC